MEFTLKDIATLLDGEIIGDESVIINKLAKIEEADTGSIAFLSNPKYENHLYSTNASAVIVQKDFKPKEEVSSSLLKVKDPYSSFSSLLEEYQRLQSLIKKGIEEPSFIGNNVEYGDNLYLAAFAYIGNNCKIGNNVKIHPHAFIGDNVTIGDNTIIHSGAKIMAASEIGSYVTIHSGVVIGSDGFGFAPQEDGTYKTIPQVGNVVIKNHVNIGANTVIDCATMGSTVIHEGAKLDNLIQVAHNVEIGKNTVIAAQAGIAGSAKIGNQNVIAGQVGIVGHISTGTNVTIGAQSGVPKDVEDNSTIIGSPALDKGIWMRTVAVMKHLPDLTRRVKQLEEKILNLPSS